MSSPLPPADNVLIGKIVAAHGLRGNIKIVSFAETLEIFEEIASLILRDLAGIDGEYAINWVKPHGRGVLLSLKGITSRDHVEALIGSELYIEKARLPQLEPGVFYWLELVGLDVITTDGSYLGKIDSIMQTGSNDVYVVKHHEHETLVPALENVVIGVDLDKKEMQVELPEGL